jgi:hypothetical protein
MSLAGVDRAEYFEVPKAAKQPPKVDFSTANQATQASR